MNAAATPLALWTSADAAAATGGRATRVWSATGLSIDSRTVKPGEVFVALEGPNFDGHDFIAAALEAGAAAAVAARRTSGIPANAPLLLVDDTMAALEALGSAARGRTRAHFLAVTGSIGKTGTKEMLRLALASHDATYASAGNLNNQWGVPLSLANMPRDTAFGVFELGMNHPNEIGPLSRQVRPRIAVVTTIEAAHLEFFPSVAAIADAKAEIFEGMDKQGIAILNRDNPHFERLKRAAQARGIDRIVAFGQHADAEARLLDCTSEAVTTRVGASILGERVDYRLSMPGRHWAINSLAALAAARLAGAGLGAAAAALSGLTPLKGRGQRSRIDLPGGAFELMDESYNASPAAVRAALQVLGETRLGTSGRRIAVLGDMRELGRESAQLHAALAADLEAAGIDLVFTAGSLMAALAAALPAGRRGAHAANSSALIPVVTAAIRPGDVVLVKGSLGSRMAPIVDALKALGSSPRPRAANGDR